MAKRRGTGSGGVRRNADGIASVKSWAALCNWIMEWRYRGCPVKNWLDDPHHLPKGEYEEQKARFIAYWCDPKSPPYPFGFQAKITRDDGTEHGIFAGWAPDEDQMKAIAATDNYRRVLATMPPKQAEESCVS